MDHHCFCCHLTEQEERLLCKTSSHWLQGITCSRYRSADWIILTRVHYAQHACAVIGYDVTGRSSSKRLKLLSSLCIVTCRHRVRIHQARTPAVCLMLGQRPRRWPNIKPTTRQLSPRPGQTYTTVWFSSRSALVQHWGTAATSRCFN